MKVPWGGILSNLNLFRIFKKIQENHHLPFSARDERKSFKGEVIHSLFTELTATNWTTALLLLFSFSPDRTIRMSENSHMKLPGHRPGLPVKVVSFHIVPLDPVHPARGGTGLSGHVPAKNHTARRRSL
jgi:hypothetical protein